MKNNSNKTPETTGVIDAKLNDPEKRKRKGTWKTVNQLLNRIFGVLFATANRHKREGRKNGL